MNISELINFLKQVKIKYGDLIVSIMNPIPHDGDGGRRESLSHITIYNDKEFCLCSQQRKSKNKLLRKPVYCFEHIWRAEEE